MPPKNRNPGKPASSSAALPASAPSSPTPAMPPKNPNRRQPQDPDPASSSAATAASSLPSPKLRIPLHLWRRAGSPLPSAVAQSSGALPPMRGAPPTQETPNLEVHPRTDPHVDRSSSSARPPPSDAPPDSQQLRLRRSLRLQESKGTSHYVGDQAQASSSSKFKLRLPSICRQQGSDAVVLPQGMDVAVIPRNSVDMEEQSGNEYHKISLMLAEHVKGISGTSGSLKSVALVVDEDMLLHESQTDKDAYENPQRLTRIISELNQQKLLERCDVFKPDEIGSRYVLAVHSQAHLKEVESIETKNQKQRNTLSKKRDDIYYSEGSRRASFLAAGGVLKACTLVTEGICKHAFALVRPPGHHAGADGPSGFCIFNNIAISAAYLLKKYQMKKILIIDWDVHHGNGTQEIFYNENRVLFISLHRQEDHFYPCSGVAGKVQSVGEGKGRGFNVNICWKHEGVRDADFIFAWDHIVLPIAEEFGPDVILISAGFDAVTDDLLGDCKLTPTGYAILLAKLIKYGSIVLALEGGYGLDPLAESLCACVKVLLGDRTDLNCSDDLPYETTVNMVTETREIHKSFWKSFENDIPPEITERSTPYTGRGRK